uniref:RIMS-binding protein 2 n=1 Tax=Strigamia maritima TaxID=126957 RepID=T1J2F4_STRMM
MKPMPVVSKTGFTVQNCPWPENEKELQCILNQAAKERLYLEHQNLESEADKLRSIEVTNACLEHRLDDLQQNYCHVETQLRQELDRNSQLSALNLNLQEQLHHLQNLLQVLSLPAENIYIQEETKRILVTSISPAIELKKPPERLLKDLSGYTPLAAAVKTLCDEHGSTTPLSITTGMVNVMPSNIFSATGPGPTPYSSSILPEICSSLPIPRLHSASPTTDCSSLPEATSTQIALITNKVEENNILVELENTRATNADTMNPHDYLIQTDDFLDIYGKGRVQVYIARYSYDPFYHSPNETPEAELFLTAGDYIYISGIMDEDGFFEGELLSGKRGLVPSNFVEQLKGEDLLEFQRTVLCGVPCIKAKQNIDVDNQVLIDEYRKAVDISFINLWDLEEEQEDMGEDDESMFLTIDRKEALDKLTIILNKLVEERDWITIDEKHWEPQELVDLVALCMDDNVFRWVGLWFRQVSGVFMGNSLSTLLAEIVARKKEDQVLKNMSKKPKLFGRFIDDMALIGNKQIIDEFGTNWNQEGTLKIKLEHSGSEVKYLDTTVKIVKSRLGTFFFVSVPAPQNLTLERQLEKCILISWCAPDGTNTAIEAYDVYVDGLLNTTVKATERTRALIEGVDSVAKFWKNGRIKIHKEGTDEKVRPVINTKACTTAGLSWVEGIKEVELDDDEQLAIFDIQSMFLTIDRKEALDELTIILNKLVDERDGITIDEKHWEPQELVDLVALCMDDNVFRWDGLWFRQASGVFMGNSLSPLLAEIPHRVSVRSVTKNKHTSQDAACTIVIWNDPPIAPSCIRATSVSATSAIISWLPSNSNFQHSVCVNNVHVRVVKAGVYRYTISGLTPFTTYRVSVHVTNIHLPLVDEQPAKELDFISSSSFVEFKTLEVGLPDPPLDIQLEVGSQNGTLLVTWLPVTINDAGTSNGAPVNGYAVYADGKKLLDIDCPTCDHALLDLTTFQGNIPKAITVRTKSFESLSPDSLATMVPVELIKGSRNKNKSRTNGSYSEPKLVELQAAHNLPRQFDILGLKLKENCVDDCYRDNSDRSELSDIAEEEEAENDILDYNEFKILWGFRVEKAEFGDFVRVDLPQAMVNCGGSSQLAKMMKNRKMALLIFDGKTTSVWREQVVRLRPKVDAIPVNQKVGIKSFEFGSTEFLDRAVFSESEKNHFKTKIQIPAMSGFLAIRGPQNSTDLAASAQLGFGQAAALLLVPCDNLRLSHNVFGTCDVEKTSI